MGDKTGCCRHWSVLPISDVMALSNMAANSLDPERKAPIKNRNLGQLWTLYNSELGVFVFVN